MLYQPDTRTPTPARQAELKAAYEANVKANNPPYLGVHIASLGELLWVLSERGWSGEFSATKDEHPNLEGVNMRGTNLARVHLVRANLSQARLEAAYLSQAYLTGADLSYVNLAGANLSGANLAEADLSGACLLVARMDVDTDLREAVVSDGMWLRDTRWNGVPLSGIDWERLHELGDGLVAERASTDEGKLKDTQTRIREFRVAETAYHQLAAVLRSQGLNEPADHFAYRAQVLQRQLLRRQGKRVKWFWWWFLGGIAGYGYRPQFTLCWYLALLAVSTCIYSWQSSMFSPDHLWYEVLGESLVAAITAVHGRGFFPGQLRTGWELTTAAFDAVAGLVLEASFVATFVQRFFAR